jgi:sulfate-transporting ATPase
LAQFALAGFGALIAGRLADAAGWPFPLALIAAVVATVPLGALFALPAVRARGINLAIVTLGLGTALEFLVFNNAGQVPKFARASRRKARQKIQSQLRRTSQQ